MVTLTATWLIVSQPCLSARHAWSATTYPKKIQDSIGCRDGPIRRTSRNHYISQEKCLTPYRGNLLPWEYWRFLLVECIPIENWEAVELNRIPPGAAKTNPNSSIGIPRRHPPVVPEGATPTPRAKQCCARDSL